MAIGGMSYDRWLKLLGRSRTTDWHWPKLGMNAVVNIGGKLYVTREADERFWQRVRAGELAKAAAELITPAAVQNRDAAKSLIQSLVSLYGRLHVIWADGGCLGALVHWVRQLCPFGKLRLETVRRCDRLRGFQILPKQWIVEGTLGWLYKSRRLCRDYEVRLDRSEAMIRICMIRLILKRLTKAV